MRATKCLLAAWPRLGLSLVVVAVVVLAPASTGATGLKHLRAHGHGGEHDADTSTTTATTTATAMTKGSSSSRGGDGSSSSSSSGSSSGSSPLRRKCPAPKKTKRRHFSVVSNPLNESGVTIVAERAVPQRWSGISGGPVPHVTNPGRFRASFCEPNRDDLNWRRVCGESSRGEDPPASWWWTCEYRQFVASLPCGYVDSDYRGKTPGMVFDRRRTFPFHASKTPSLQPLVNPPRRVERFARLAHNIGVYPTATAHVVVQLPRLLFLLATIPSDVPILLASSSPMLKELIGLLSEAGLLDEGRVISWQPDTTYYADTLYFAGEVARGDATGGHWDSLGAAEACSGAMAMPRRLVQEFATNFLAAKRVSPPSSRPPPPGPIVSRDGRLLRRPRIVVIDRSDARAGTRAISNQAALLRSLDRAVGDNCTIDVFVGRENSISATVELFAGADVIVGPHGAALSFASFTRPGWSNKAVVEIGFASRESMPFPASYYMAIALSVGAQYYLTMASGKYDGRLKVDVHDAAKVVRAAVDGLLTADRLPSSSSNNQQQRRS